MARSTCACCAGLWTLADFTKWSLFAIHPSFGSWWTGSWRCAIDRCLCPAGMLLLSFCPQTLVGRWVTVRKAVNRIPLIPHLAESREVQAAYQNTLGLIKFVLR